MDVVKKAEPATVSSTVPDWSRETSKRYWNPGVRLIRSIRFYQKYSNKPFLRWLKYFGVVRYRFWSAVSGADIPLNCEIGGGLLMPHPNGIVIHPDAVIGVNCLVFQQVTIGTNGKGVPVVGGHIDIGAGAKVLGPIFIEEHARIGANAVVTKDVLAGAVVKGF
ncbi:serine acetyltransferase [Nitrincola iocasae]|uniref:Serine acetyltransferase n=1 Tax=Nitrincola iocasae TaxID=2614693 RepID=A0A5J6LCI7_9GAMM|nr:serine acetyltransferase [Nitrincola iocasae]QEW06253.1 serine acetyltransferase [Nitrincola iocasae]